MADQVDRRQQTVEAIELQLKAASVEYSRMVRADAEIAELVVKAGADGDFGTSPLAMRLLLAAMMHAPIEIYERARAEHWQEHGGVHGGEACVGCGFVDAAIYQAKTGRSLAADFRPVRGSHV